MMVFDDKNIYFKNANGRPVSVLTGGAGRPNPVAQPLPPQVPLQRTARPVPVQQTWRLNP
jgi:hypothetical protein